MRKKAIDGIYIGSIVDCQGVSPDWAVIHACRSPCFCSKVPKPNPSRPDYLSFKDGNHLYLNIIDPREPLFQKRMFEEFLAFAKTKWEEQRKILIHCNQGRSRAPSLALLFLAKIAFRVTNKSYDDAWLEFEKLIGEPYIPSQGIEQWLREHWSEIDQAAQIPPPARLPDPPVFPPPAGRTYTQEEGLAIAKSIPLVHFKGFIQIEDKEHRWINPDPNSLQYDVNEAYTWCIENKIPCRLMVLKPRQVGCSTICGHICYHHMRRFQADMVMMADVSKRTEKIWEIFNQMSQHDSFEQLWGSHYDFNTIRGNMHYPDGSKGLVEHDTALDPKAGVSGTRQVVWMSEAARFMKTGGRDKKVVTAMLNSLANVPNSLGIAESTAEGAFGWFYENWQGAVTLEDRKKGVIGNGWLRVFAAWHEFKEHRLPKTIDNLSYFNPESDHRERRGQALYRWTMSQIAWRRMKIAKDCGGDARMFDQDFPEDAESCFLASGRPRFDMEKVVQMEKQARFAYPLGKMGVVERSETGQVSFTERTDGSAWLWMDEKPEPGRSYLAIIDPCQGEQSEGSPFPDAHAIGIIRKGYFIGSEWIKPKLVAAIDVPTGCRWENYLAAERAKMLSDFYGECMIIPETGNGLGMIEALRRVGAYLYQRQKNDAMYPGKLLNVVGWETNSNTRPIVVDAMGNAIGQETFECNFLPAILEMKTFIINDRGRAAAKNGMHDDWVMMLGIGLANIDFAKPMPQPRQKTYRGPAEADSPQSLSGMPIKALS